MKYNDNGDPSDERGSDFDPGNRPSSDDTDDSDDEVPIFDDEAFDGHGRPHDADEFDATEDPLDDTDEEGDDLPTPRSEDVDPSSVREAVLEDVKGFFHFLGDVGSVSADDPRFQAGTMDSASGPDGETSPADDFTPTAADVGPIPETVADVPGDSFIENNWFDFTYIEGHEEVTRYWVNKPYAYVSVLYNPETKKYRYQATEPMLSAFEEYVREDLIRILRNSLMYEDVDEEEERVAVFRRKATEIIAEHAATVEDGSVYKLLYFLLRDFLDFGRIDPMMRDPNIEDISCDGVEVPVFVYHRSYRDLRTNVSFGERALNSMVVRIAQRAGKHISVSNPLVDATLSDGSRVQLTLGEDVSSRGSNFTIRKFSEVPYTPVDLIKWNTFSVEEMAYFWLAIENNRSLIFSGGTGSGKTTSMNAVGFFIPPESKVVSIEDTREITLPHDNWVSSVTRASIGSGGAGEITTYQLLQAALRQRPEYLLVGEIRTEANVALTFFQAIGTGHTSYTTLHADSIESALSRLQNPPLGVPAQMIRDLDIVSIQKQIFRGTSRVRRNDGVHEILPDESEYGTVDTRQIFARNPESDTFHRVGDSRVLADIAEQRGWGDERLADELDKRERVLRYLVEKDITGYADVSATIHTFFADSEYILDRIASEELEPSELPTVTAEAR